MSTVTGEVVINEAAERLGGLEGKKVLVIGVGNVGLSAALTAAKKGATVIALSTSPTFRSKLQEQGIEFELIQDEQNGTMSPDDALSLQRASVRNHLRGAHVIVCSARRVGQTPPRLITEKDYIHIRTGALVYDTTASSGGNCEGNVYGQDTPAGGFTICSKKGYPKAAPVQASALYGACASRFLSVLLWRDWETRSVQAVTACCIVADGQINPVSKLEGTDAARFPGAAQYALSQFWQRVSR